MLHRTLELAHRVLIAGLIVLAATTTRANAHPHIWASMETEILHDAQQQVTGFRHTWTFDEYYSSFALQGVDKNRNGVYEQEELKELAEVNITSLSDYRFFTFPKLAGQDIECGEPNDYWLEYQNGMLTLHFTLPLKKPVPKARLNDFQFAVYDATFYIAFSLAKKNPIHLAPGLDDCQAEISKPQAQTPPKSLAESLFSSNNALMNFGQQYAEIVQLKCGL